MLKTRVRSSWPKWGCFNSKWSHRIYHVNEKSAHTTHSDTVDWTGASTSLFLIDKVCSHCPVPTFWCIWWPHGAAMWCHAIEMKWKLWGLTWLFQGTGIHHSQQVTQLFKLVKQLIVLQVILTTKFVIRTLASVTQLFKLVTGKQFSFLFSTWWSLCFHSLASMF